MNLGTIFIGRTRKYSLMLLMRNRSLSKIGNLTSIKITFQTFLLRIFFQLLNKTFVGVDLTKIEIYLLPLPLDHLNNLTQRSFIFLQKIGHNNGYTSTHPRHTMHQYIGILPSLINKIKSSVEMPVQLITLMIVSRYIQVIRHVLLLVPQQSTPSDRKNSPNIKS